MWKIGAVILFFVVAGCVGNGGSGGDVGWYRPKTSYVQFRRDMARCQILADRRSGDFDPEVTADPGTSALAGTLQGIGYALQFQAHVRLCMESKGYVRTG